MAKFQFDNPFDEASAKTLARKKARAEPPPPPEPQYGPAELAAARDMAFAEGLQRGRMEAEGEIEARVADLLDRVGGDLDQIFQEHRRSVVALRREAVEIAVAAAKRLALGLIEKSAERSVEKLLHELLGELRDEPRITLRVNDQIAEVLGPRIDTLAAQEGFAGTVQLIPDPGMAPGNCRIEWGAGGVERSIDTIAERIDAAVAGYLAANAASG